MGLEPSKVKGLAMAVISLLDRGLTIKKRRTDELVPKTTRMGQVYVPTPMARGALGVTTAPTFRRGKPSSKSEEQSPLPVRSPIPMPELGAT